MNTEETINSVEEAPAELETMAEFFKDTEAEKPEAVVSGEAPEMEEKAKPKSLKSLAEKLEIEDKDLYEIEVPFANGESRTLGELKDLASTQDNITVREMEFEETRIKREAEMLQAQNELKELVSSLPPGAIKPEMLEKTRQKMEVANQQERVRTLEVIPEWTDEAKRTDEIQGIVGYLADYGLPESFLAQSVDHRVLKLLRDSWQRKERMDKALERVKTKTVSSPASKKNPSATKKPRDTQRVYKGPNSQLADFLK